MKVSYKWLQTYFESKLAEPKDLADLINAHSFEVEQIEQIVDDTSFEIKVMPDRAHYALCHKGIAREIKVLTGMELKPVTATQIPETIQTVVKVSVADSDLCYRYMARRIENISVKESPELLKKSLETIGARSVNNIVDATNSVMYDVGQPLHAFDADKVVGEIIIRRAKNGEKIELIQAGFLQKSEPNQTRVVELTENDLVIADTEGVLAVAGVKGGKKAEITAETKNIIVESANFNSIAVRRTSTRLNLRNESSKRFESEIIPELTEEAMNEFCSIIMEFCPEAKFGPVSDVFLKKTEPWQVGFSLDYLRQKVGIDLDPAEVLKILGGLECKITEAENEYNAIPPLDRLDLKIKEDFADEIARIKGYEVVPAIMPPSLSEATPIDKTFFWSEKFKETLVEMGFSEVLLYSLVDKGCFVIEHPLAKDKGALRESIIPSMKHVLKANGLNAELLGIETIKIFEIGKVFTKDGEKTVFTVGVNHIRKKKGMNSELILRDTLENLQKIFRMNIQPEIHIDGQIAIAEFDFDQIIENLPEAGSIQNLNVKILPKDHKFQVFSLFPFIVRDVAVFVPKNVDAKEVEDLILQTLDEPIKNHKPKDLLVRHSLFDVFEKDSKVSYAYRLVLQAFDRTLTDEEANKIMEKIHKEIKAKKWEVR